MSSTCWERIFTTIRNLFHTFMFYILKSTYLYCSQGNFFFMFYILKSTYLYCSRGYFFKNNYFLYVLSKIKRTLVSSYFQYSPVERDSFGHIREYSRRLWFSVNGPRLVHYTWSKNFLSGICGFGTSEWWEYVQYEAGDKNLFSSFIFSQNWPKLTKFFKILEKKLSICLTVEVKKRESLQDVAYPPLSRFAQHLRKKRYPYFQVFQFCSSFFKFICKFDIFFFWFSSIERWQFYPHMVSLSDSFSFSIFLLNNKRVRAT